MKRMKTMLIGTIISLTSLGSICAHSAVTDQIQIKGKLKAILADVVVLEVKSGSGVRKVKIKKSDAGNLKGVAVGTANIVVQTSLASIIKLNGTL